MNDKELIRELRESLGRITAALIRRGDPTVIPGDAAEWALKRIKENKEKLQERDDELERWPDLVSDAIGPNYINRNGEDVLTQITRVITDLEAKVKLAEDFGMVFGILKSSDCPEGKMALDVKEGSDLWRLELEVAENIESRIAVEDLLNLVRTVKETKVSISMSNSPWPGRDGDGFVIPSDVIKNLEPLFESLGESTPYAMGRGLGAAMMAWFKNKAKEEGTTVQQEIEKVIGKKPEKKSEGVTCPACKGKEPETVKDMCDLCNGMGVVYRFIAEKYAGKGKRDDRRDR